MKNYIDEAHVTASNKFYADRIERKHLHFVIQSAIDVLRELDKIKKTIFYGKDCSIPSPRPGMADLNRLVDDFMKNNNLNKAQAVNVIHGIIGKATEIGELLAAFLAVMNGHEFDDVNVSEEIGDGLWYDALILKAIDSNFDEAQTINIAKLRKRFPEAFTEFDANNRNLAEEREVLKKNKPFKVPKGAREDGR